MSRGRKIFLLVLELRSVAEVMMSKMPYRASIPLDCAVPLGLNSTVNGTTGAAWVSQLEMMTCFEPRSTEQE